MLFKLRSAAPLSAARRPCIGAESQVWHRPACNHCSISSKSQLSAATISTSAFPGSSCATHLLAGAVDASVRRVWCSNEQRALPLADCRVM